MISQYNTDMASKISVSGYHQSFRCLSLEPDAEDNYEHSVWIGILTGFLDTIVSLKELEHESVK